MERVSTPLLCLLRVMCLLSGLCRPPHLSLPPQPRLLLHLPFHSSGRRKQSPASPPPHPAPTRTGRLIRPSLPPVSAVTPPSLWCKTRLKNKLFSGGTVVLLPPPHGLKSPRRRPWPSAPQRAPPPAIAPLFRAAVLGRAGWNGTVV